MRSAAWSGIANCIAATAATPLRASAAAVPENKSPGPVAAPEHEFGTTRQGIGRAWCSRSANRLASTRSVPASSPVSASTPSSLSGSKSPCSGKAPHIEAALSKTTGRFHLPARALGYQPVMDYKTGQLGIQGSADGRGGTGSYAAWYSGRRGLQIVADQAGRPIRPRRASAGGQHALRPARTELLERGRPRRAR
jgi:hypothetical protein